LGSNCKAKQGKKLSSYFISPDFAYEVESDLRHQICDVASPSQAFLRSLEAVNEGMAVHIRLGDFEATNPRVRDEMLGYFLRAASLAKRLNPDGRGLSLFSDQPDRAEEIL